MKKLRFGSILTKILGQHYTEDCSKSVFLNKFGDIWAPLPEATFEVLLAAGGPNNKKSHSGVYHFVV